MPASEAEKSHRPDEETTPLKEKSTTMNGRNRRKTRYAHSRKNSARGWDAITPSIFQPGRRFHTAANAAAPDKSPALGEKTWKRANAALQTLEAAGLLRWGRRGLEVLDLHGLRRYASPAA